jgi:hypothetical protein
MDLDPIPQVIADDPHAVYRVLREENPVHYVEERREDPRVVDRLERLPSDTNRGFSKLPMVL